MRFGAMATVEAEGATLAHAAHADGLIFKKGRRLNAADVRTLLDAGIEQVVAAVFEPGDVPEDEAAALLARALAGDGLKIDRAFTGRVNLFAEPSGLILVDAERIDRLNGLHEAVTLATLANHAPVAAGAMIATIKIIPFTAPRAALDSCLAIIGTDLLVKIAPYRAQRIGLIQTELPGTSVKMLDKTTRITAARIASVGGSLPFEQRCAHAVPALVRSLAEATARGFDILLIAGASAITDRRDVLPAAIEAAGGTVLHFGMPVDPGNLLLLGRLGGRPVLGLPGCARSPKLNGFDWVLQRLAADLPVSGRDLMGMGVGGLLTEIPTRPQPRLGDAPGLATARRGRPRIAAILLAAGQSRRMGGPNKLLANLDGQPLVGHAARAVLASAVEQVVVVTGHQAEAVTAALRPLASGDRQRFVHNQDFAQGLSSSLRAGLGALGPEIDGVVVCLGDMPRVTPGLIDRLIAAFAPVEGRAIIVPTRDGRRGNPVLWARTFWPAMRELDGDVGARHLIGEHAEAVAEIAVDDAASLTDVDTPEALAALRVPRDREPAAVG